MRLRAKDEVDTIIGWLADHSDEQIAHLVGVALVFQALFDHVPALNPNAGLLAGVASSVQMEPIEGQVARKAQRPGKPIDELARGRPMDQIPRV